MGGKETNPDEPHHHPPAGPVNGRGRRAAARTSLGAALLIGAVWWLGKAVGQHRRAARQMGVRR